MSMIGKSLAHYEITSLIGKGGMGEVYQAKDRKLGRNVAIKVLPEEFAGDTDRRARFQREAKLLASLNHPNIASIYGLEESGGTHFLVLELIEGETLADRIRKGPIPAEESLKLALQIAEALEAAHDKSVIHRDLKPSNVKITPDGKVKVLDFGLAKAYAGSPESMNLSNSPTLSDAATRQGVILGTAAYMSPEQAKGRAVDKRTDIWAFGCVLYEMLTGQAAFQGEDVTEILAAVVKLGANLDLLPANLHPRVREIIIRCLQRDLKKRYSSITDARYEIEQALPDPSGLLVRAITGVEPRRKLQTILPWAAATLVLGLIIAGVAVWKLRTPEPRQVMRFSHELPEGQQFNHGDAGSLNLAVSPNGSHFVYGTTEGFYLRSVDALDARLIAGTGKDSIQPFFSPDGQWIGYHSRYDQKLKKIAISGGAPVVICDVPGVLGARWNSDNTIVYSSFPMGIMRVSADGGTPELIIGVGMADIGKKEGLPVAPQMLPDRKTLLFTKLYSLNPFNMEIVIQSLKSGEQRVLVKSGAVATYLPTGHLVYGLENNGISNLLAVPFDLDRLEVTGGSVPILEGTRDAAVSDSGTLVYVPGTASAASSDQRTLVWVDRKGKEEPIPTIPNDYGSLKISPDGTRVALSVTAGSTKSDIWIWDILRENLTRLTFNETSYYPLWTLDGRRIAFIAGITASTPIYWKAADGSGEDELVGSVQNRFLAPASWSRDRKNLVMIELTLSGGLTTDIGVLPMEGDRKWRPLLKEKYSETSPRISPDDGRWMAYASNESGRFEVYVRPFPEVNKGRWQVSTGGGIDPLWSPNGRELFYRYGDTVMAVSVETDPIFKSGKPEVLFQGKYVRSSGLEIGNTWDISPDGKRFLMMKAVQATGETTKVQAPRRINIVLNWFEELKAKVPAP